MSVPFGQDSASRLARASVRRWLGLDVELADAKGRPQATTTRPALCELARAADRGQKCCAAVAAAGKQALRQGPGLFACHIGLTIAAAARGGVVASEVASIVHVCGIRSAEATATVPPQLGQAITDAEWQARWSEHPELAHPAALTATLFALNDQLQTSTTDSDAPPKHAHPFSEIVGRAPAVLQMAALLEKVVRTHATVLIHGESGTGKELIARALHYHGPRAKKPFVVQNCSAFNDNLLESALFGHVKGAFTGAVKDQKGLFEVADGGTFFLDEIGDMSAALQVKLLRVLQEGTFTPVGGTKPVKVDVRIIAASHKDLATMVARREFREDLFFRVNVLKITVPPLRDRVADIPDLARHFVRKHHDQARAGDRPVPTLTDSAIAKLCAYAWPGNIRELENEIERMRVLAGDAAEFTGDMVSARVAAASGGSAGGKPLAQVVAEAEYQAIVDELRATGFVRDTAAARLGISRALLDAKCLTLGIENS